ncbi:glycosyltransferase family 2 protein [Anthocerotibacter panamensis]|uniref:glycosyltransferase family 2 protein n=1 Tax=Anthocerotibacter panamensis TaxID=2857077 RepID=UPI001C40247A|nr:glycosyltransferase [Anthocerotibacter panamensis]
MTEEILRDPERVQHYKNFFPTIAPVPEGIARPFWSVMIPVYNRTTYLEETLRSVLIQDPGPESMQIEVIDNSYNKIDVESFVSIIAGDRVSFYRQPKSLEVAGNWNTCIERARGYWVHILHDDDLVLPNFYQQFYNTLKRRSKVGAVICRHTSIDNFRNKEYLSSLERETPGFLDNWIERIATQQRIQCPAIVVRRAAYETIGGFSPELTYSVDWEMWKRIAVHYPIWFIPEILAYYRVHQQSMTTKLLSTNTDFLDIHKSLELSKYYLPPQSAKALNAKAAEVYALWSMGQVQTMFAEGKIYPALARLVEALKFSPSQAVFKRTVSTLLRVLLRRPLMRRLDSSN